MTALFSSSHVHSTQGERTAAEKVPSSFKPSTYLRATSITWTSWDDAAATGYARLSTTFPGEVLSPGHRVRMELSCPVSHNGTTYFGRYDIEWLDDPPTAGMDGWEQEGPITVLPGCG